MTALFLAALFAALGLRLWLSRRQERHVRAHRDAVPAPFAGVVPREAHEKAADYTIARTRFRRVAAVWRAALLLLLTLGGGLELLGEVFTGETLPSATAYVLGAFLALEIAQLPLSLWATFRLEERFGFNRTTPGLFAVDLVKQLSLGVAVGGPLIAGALWLVREGGAGWWLKLWAGWLAVSLLLTWAYPRFLAPIFNRFRPLGDEALRRRLDALLERAGYESGGIYVMDGSRRSTHANAYFTGFGKEKRIVFFDTLCEMLEPPEVEAVLAHELGHFKLGHVWARLAASAAFAAAGLWLFSRLIERRWFFEGLGVPEPSAHAGIVLLALVGPVFLFLGRPLAAAWSRRQEYQADAFAAAQADGRALERALVKLYEHNASTLTPDPVHSRFFDSHPPAPLRIARLRGAAAA